MFDYMYGEFGIDEGGFLFGMEEEEGMVIKAVIDRIRSQQSLVDKILPIGDATDKNIGQGSVPYILVGYLTITVA